MYKCEVCGKFTKPHERLKTKIVDVRWKQYVNEHTDKHGNTYETYSKGYEIAKEVKVCEECFNKEDNQPIQKVRY